MESIDEAPENTLPLNEESLLRPISGLEKVLNTVDQSKDRPSSNGANAIWEQYRNENTTTPTNGAQDYEDDNFANKTYPSEETTPQSEAVNPDVSIFSKFASTMAPSTGQSHYLSIKDYKEQLEKAKNEIFGLKLRIHLLEKNQGLINSPEDKENVYKVNMKQNIDLKVENDLLKKEVDEIKETLNDAYLAVNEYAKEAKEKEAKDAEISELKNEIEDLKNKEAEKDFVFQHQQININGDAGRQSMSRHVEEAFSMNLGAHSGDNEFEEMTEKIHTLETDLNIERDHSQDLKRLLKEHEDKMEELAQDLIEKEKKLFSSEDNQKALLAAKEETIDVLQTEIKNNREQLATLEDKIINKEKDADDVHVKLLDLNDKVEHLTKQNFALRGQLDLDQKAAEELNSRHNQEIFELNEALISAQKALDEELSNSKDQQTYLNIKLADISQLHKTNADLEAKLKEKICILAKTEENLTKTTKCVEGLTEVCKELNETKIDLEKQLMIKSKSLDRMVKEYDIAKAKVRQYRAERMSNSSVSSQADEGVDQNFAVPSKLISKHQKNQFIKHGASIALNQAQNLYNDQLQRFEYQHQNIMSMMRRRLEELAQFIEMLLSNGLLNIDCLDETIRDALQKSLNESKNITLSNLDDTFSDDPALRIPLPRIQINVEELELNIDQVHDVSKILEDLKTAHEEEIANMKTEIDHLRNNIHESETLEKQKCELEMHVGDLKEKFEFTIAEKSSKIEELRVKYGNAQEKIKRLNEEVEKLKDRTKALKELSKLQSENQLLKQKIQKETKTVDDAVHEYKVANQKLLQQKSKDDSELEILRSKLAIANEKLQKIKEKQEKVDKALRVQLAKTHKVLKRTKENVDSNLQ